MLKFHEEMSPVKTLEVEKAVVAYSEERKFLSTCPYIPVGVLKTIVGILGPTLLPAIVYYFQGSSPLFWQVTAVSCVLALLIIITVLCLNLATNQDRIRELLNSLSGSDGVLESLRQVLTYDFLKTNLHRILCPVALLLVGGLLSYVTYAMDNWLGFYASLVSVGFICGILTAVVFDMLRSPELLPFHSPCKIRMELTTPTRQAAKREMEFSRNQDPVPTPRLLTPHTALVDENPELTATPTTSVLPNYASAINRAEAGNTKMYQLPINFGKFLRALQS